MGRRRGSAIVHPLIHCIIPCPQFPFRIHRFTHTNHTHIQKNTHTYNTLFSQQVGKTSSLVGASLNHLLGDSSFMGSALLGQLSPSSSSPPHRYMSGVHAHARVLVGLLSTKTRMHIPTSSSSPPHRYMFCFGIRPCDPSFLDECMHGPSINSRGGHPNSPLRHQRERADRDVLDGSLASSSSATSHQQVYRHSQPHPLTAQRVSKSRHHS